MRQVCAGLAVCWPRSVLALCVEVVVGRHSMDGWQQRLLNQALHGMCYISQP